ncbi:MAG: SAM-dependent methyltransferase [Defluviitaleaceae bacterium]|nr:SAM-dependent methyltransferase [Defluviitaleaceae bacterium]MCL2240839.1 SAM-dependent methyltransferase [Defluviitaleaceae bacterium]
MNRVVIFNQMHKIMLSGPVKGAEYIRGEIIKNGEGFQAALYTQKQVFHKNLAADALQDFMESLLGAAFTHYTAWDGQYRHAARLSKKGKWLTSRTADTTPPKAEKAKNHIFRERMAIPALVDMGVFTKELKVASPMRDKFVQINRFLELVSDETKGLPPQTALNIIDFGCGKSYLTFLMYHYFVEMRGLRVRICGLDTDAKLVGQCNEAAKKYGYTGLTFAEGDIGQQKKPPPESWGQENTFNLVVSLHACDTATDHALFNALQWNADVICAVPCCQHELRGQLQKPSDKSPLALFSRYGIIQERVASLATDALRAAMLESAGYKVQIIELTDRENTAKNLMIRARKTGQASASQREKAAMQEAEQLMAAFGFTPTLWRLLNSRI